jgi:hypothetical protein
VPNKLREKNGDFFMWKDVIKEEGRTDYSKIQDEVRAMLEENDTMGALDLAMRTLGKFTDGFFGDIHDIIRKEVGEEGLLNIIDGITEGY